MEKAAQCTCLKASWGRDGIIFGGPKHVSFCIEGSPKIQVIVEQELKRIITISADSEINASYLHSVFSRVERLLMLFGGSFFPLETLEFTGVTETPDHMLKAYAQHCLIGRLSYFESSDFCKCTVNKLIDFSDVLSGNLYCIWEDILGELDIVHQVFLYSSSNNGQPVDIKSAFLIELAEPIVEIIKDRKHYFSSLTPRERGTSLKNCLDALICKYGEDVFAAELSTNYDAFLQILVNSRVRIMHIKHAQRGYHFDGPESILYSAKMSLLYRKVIFELLGVEENKYVGSLTRCIRYWNQWNDILPKFELKLKKQGKMRE